MLALFASLAAAGDLTVTTFVPLAVFVDGVQRPAIPGTTTVPVPQLVGAHRVDLVGATGQVVGSQVVDVPVMGLVQLTFDGARFSVQTAAAPAAPVFASGPALVVVPPAPAAPPPAPAGPVVMDDGAFQRLLSAVRSASFSDGKLAAVAAAARGHAFTIRQVAQLARQASFGSDQLEIVRICAPKVVDPQNAFELGDVFSFDSDKEAALALFR